MASGKKIIDGEDGRYLVECDGHGYTITSQNDKSVVRLDFDEEDNSWSVVTPEGQSYEFMTFIDENHVSMPAPDGSRRLVDLSREGVWAYQQEAIAARQLVAAR